MRVATRPLIVVGTLFVLGACTAAAVYRPGAFAPEAPTPRTVPQRAAAPAPAIIPRPVAAPPPPAVSAIGSDRGFGSQGDIWLRAGRFIWRPELASDGPVGILIDLGRQMAYVYRAGALIGVTTVSTGRRHHETPVGDYPILEKAVWHRSTIYSGAPMPYMQRLTWSGVALHAGGVPGYRQSHGCIHLPPAFARSLFKVTRIGSEVRVVRSIDDARTPVGPPIVLAARAPFPTTAQSAATIIAAAL